MGSKKKDKEMGNFLFLLIKCVYIIFSMKYMNNNDFNINNVVEICSLNDNWKSMALNYNKTYSQTALYIVYYYIHK